MKIESSSSIQIDPVRIERIGVELKAITQRSTNQKREVTQPHNVLQKETRSAEEIRKDLDVINNQLKIMNRSIQFSVDDDTHDIVVSLVDKESGKVIRQLPPESVLRLREHMADVSGLIVEEEV